MATCMKKLMSMLLLLEKHTRAMELACQAMCYYFSKCYEKSTRLTQVHRLTPHSSGLRLPYSTTGSVFNSRLALTCSICRDILRYLITTFCVSTSPFDPHRFICNVQLSSESKRELNLFRHRDASRKARAQQS